MTRVHSASTLKSAARGRALVGRLPEPGSATRRVYDALYAARGALVWAEVVYDAAGEPYGVARRASKLAEILRRLEDYYGCDVRSFGRGADRTLSLVGESHSRVYVDYTREARERACE